MSKKIQHRYRSEGFDPYGGQELMDNLNDFANKHGVEIKDVRVSLSEDWMHLSAYTPETPEERTARLKSEKEADQRLKEQRRLEYEKLKKEFDIT